MHGTSVAEATSDASGEVCSEVTAPRRWCAVWTRSRHEALVHQQLEGEPAPIPDVEIEGIRQLVETDLQYDPCPLVREGMMVEVVHGPLTGVVGRLVRKGSHARLVLSVDLISQAVSVEAHAADAKPY